MGYIKLNLFYVLVFCNLFILFGQQKLSEQSEVSVLTFGAGESLNDAFGHNAFRIKDYTKKIDLVFGFGGYDFDTPNFYLKFAQGKLNYQLTKHNFSDVLNFYRRSNRTIESQILNLNLQEKQQLYSFLNKNYKPQNRAYLYDFFFDNCATRIRDVTEYTLPNAINYQKIPNAKKTFRDLIYEHVDKNSWGSFGIDLALGSLIDRQAKEREFMFLPKYINSSFKNAKINDSIPLVATSETLFTKKSQHSPILTTILSPLVALALLCLVPLYLTYKDFKNKALSKWVDICMLTITSFIGILLLLLWFATDHIVTGYNYNLLWAFPLNVIVILQFYRNTIKPWVKGYLKFLILMLCLLVLHWLMAVQIFAIALIPVIIALVVRYAYIIYFLNNTEH